MNETTEDVLNRLETGIRTALSYELRYSKKNGFEKGHYWLHRKINQLLEEMREHYELEAWTPHFTNDSDYIRGMIQAYRDAIELCPEKEAEIKNHIRDEQGSAFVRLLNPRSRKRSAI
jgi:hypothetical protein